MTAPDAASLHRAALNHLARYATTRASLVAVLDRRVGRWAKRASQAGDPEAVAAASDALRQTVRETVARLAEAGLVDDRTFAEVRARRLVRAGRSRSAILAHLATKGVEHAVAEESLPVDGETELLAALAFARRRRFGPFRRASDDDADGSVQVRALAAFARAGFRHETARRALHMESEDARRRLEATHPDRA